MTGSRLRVAARAPCPRPLIDTPFVPSCPLRQADWQIDALTTPFESSRPGGLGAAPLCESRNSLALNSMRSSRAANCRLWARRSPLRIRSFPFIFDRPRANLRSGVLGPGSWVLGPPQARVLAGGSSALCVFLRTTPTTHPAAARPRCAGAARARHCTALHHRCSTIHSSGPRSQRRARSRDKTMGDVEDRFPRAALSHHPHAASPCLSPSLLVVRPDARCRLHRNVEDAPP